MLISTDDYDRSDLLRKHLSLRAVCFLINLCILADCVTRLCKLIVSQNERLLLVHTRLIPV